MKFKRQSLTITPVEPKPLLSRVRYLAHILALPAVVFFKLSGDSEIASVEGDLRLERFCRLSENFTQEECNSMKEENYTYVKEVCQIQDVQFTRQSNAISIPVSCFVIAFLASWSDRYGRIILLRLSIVGYFLAGIVYILFDSLEEWPVEVLLAATALQSLAGGSPLFLMALFSSAVDRYTKENRRLAIGMFTNLIVIGQATGMVEAKLVEFWSGGTFWVIFTALLNEILAMVITIFLIKEYHGGFKVREAPRHKRACMDLIRPKNISDIVVVAFRRRPQRDRLHMLLILFVNFFVLFSPPSYMEEWTTIYLGWSDLNYTIMSSVFMVTCQIFTTVFLRLTVRSAVSETITAATAEGMTAVQDLLLITVTGPCLSPVVYFAMVFSSSHNLSNVGIRYALCQIVEDREIGRIFGIMAIQDTFMTLIKDVAFKSLWDATRDAFPTSQHLMSASFAILNSGVLFVVYFTTKTLARENGGREVASIKDNEKIEIISIIENGKSDLMSIKENGNIDIIKEIRKSDKTLKETETSDVLLIEECWKTEELPVLENINKVSRSLLTRKSANVHLNCQEIRPNTNDAIETDGQIGYDNPCLEMDTKL